MPSHSLARILFLCFFPREHREKGWETLPHIIARLYLRTTLTLCPVHPHTANEVSFTIILWEHKSNIFLILQTRKGRRERSCGLPKATPSVGDRWDGQSVTEGGTLHFLFQQTLDRIRALSFSEQVVDPNRGTVPI